MTTEGQSWENDLKLRGCAPEVAEIAGEIKELFAEWMQGTAADDKVRGMHGFQGIMGEGGKNLYVCFVAAIGEKTGPDFDARGLMEASYRAIQAALPPHLRRES
jgi:hypothetical protein